MFGVGCCGAKLDKLLPRRGGSGQATKRRESALLAGTIRGATCLGARGRLPPTNPYSSSSAIAAALFDA